MVVEHGLNGGLLGSGAHGLDLGKMIDPGLFFLDDLLLYHDYIFSVWWKIMAILAIGVTGSAVPVVGGQKRIDPVRIMCRFGGAARLEGGPISCLAGMQTRTTRGGLIMALITHFKRRCAWIADQTGMSGVFIG